MHVHFIAVAGTGMGSLAGLLQSAGHRVTGSDVAFYPPMGPALKRWGIELHEGFRPEHLNPPPDLVVVGNVCRRDNPEARAAIDGGLKYVHMCDEGNTTKGAYPSGTRAFGSNLTDTGLDVKVAAAINGPHQVKVAIAQGATIRDAMATMHWQHTCFQMGCLQMGCLQEL